MIFKLYYASYYISLSVYMHEVNYKLVICNERGISSNTRTITKSDHTTCSIYEKGHRWVMEDSSGNYASLIKGNFSYPSISLNL